MSGEKGKKADTKRVWAVFIGCMLYYGALMGVYNCVGVLITGIMNAEGYTSSSLSGYYTARNLFQAIGMLVTAGFLKRRSIRLVTACVGICTTVSLLLMCVYSRPWMWIVSGVISGIGNSLSMLLPTTVINAWFVKKKGTFLGIVTMLSGILGMILNPLVAEYITAEGWRSAAVLLGVSSLVLNLTAACLLVKRPRDVGAVPYGGEETDPVPTDAGRVSRLGTEKITLRELGVYLFVLLTVSMTAKGIQMTSYVPQYSTSLGYPLEIGGRLTSAIMIGNFSAKLLYGVVCDRIGAWPSVQVFLGIIGTAFLLLSLFGGVLPVMYAACVLLGFSYMSGLALSMVAVELFDRDRFETQYSRCSMFGTLTTFPIPFLVSYVFDLTGSFRLIFMTYACLLYLGILLVWLRRRLGVVRK